MKPITPLSQNDSKWKYEKLGYGGTTIGSYGCLVTALTCLARIDDVRKVNDVLKSNNGYVGDNGNLVVWAAVSKIPGLTFKYRYYSYDNEKVKQIIAKNGGCIIEVDGAPIGGYRHWLLFIGDGKLIDTWDGKIKSTNTYSPISFVDVEYKESESMADTIQIEKTVFEQLVTKSTKYDEFVNKGFSNVNQVTELCKQKDEELESERKSKEEAQKALVTANNAKTASDIKIKQLSEDLEDVSLVLGESTSVNLELKYQLDQREEELAKCLADSGQPTNLEDPILTKIADWIKKILGKLK